MDVALDKRPPVVVGKGKPLMRYHRQISGTRCTFSSLVEVMAKASPVRSGDELAGCAARSDAERAAARTISPANSLVRRTTRSSARRPRVPRQSSDVA
ncbi:hypothetical protein CH274_26230 [Rhodococcus sp. 06-418-5]|nr:hypothetical protein CH274_26230 [Rhodococcus sp. 06-418-5]